MIGKYRMRLIGALTGPIWWPSGAIAGRQIDVDLVSEAGRMDNPTLRELLLHIVHERGGDFQGCDFTSDTEIVITRDRAQRTGFNTIRSRYWPITAFKSVADMVKADTYAGDFG